MLDATTFLPTFTQWRDAVAHGDLLMFAHPDGASSRDGAAQARPCLVVDLARIGGRRFVALAAGVPDHGGPARGYDVVVRDPRAGDGRPLRFCAARRLLVPLDHAGFETGPNGSPRLGALEGRELDRLNRVRARLHAEHDIAMDRRERRLAERREAAAPVTLEPMGAARGGAR